MKNLLYLAFIGILFSCQTQQRPNIIYIMSDDHAAHAISAYGGLYDEVAPTPNIDRIADEGVKFNNVFCTNAICGPSRATIITGKYSHTNGYYKNEGGGQFDASQWTFPKALQESGYQTALLGKWHLGTEPVGFDFFKYHNNPGQQGYYWNPVYNENGKQVKEEGYATNLTTDFALEWLQNRDNEKPFCMLLQYKAPHRPWDPDKKYEDLWEDIEMPYPSTFNDDYKTREKTAGDTWMTMDFFNHKDMKTPRPEGMSDKEFQKWGNEGNNINEAWSPNPEWSTEEVRKWKYQKYIKDYLACIKSVDDNIGRVLDYLKENGLDKNTVVIYTADQGFYLGEHGFFDKRFIYEESLRMPFLVKYPEKFQAGTENSDIITNVDFAPFILELAGLDAPSDLQGRSFVANLTQETPTDWPTSMYYHYYEYPFWHHVHPHYGIRNQRYKLAHFYHNQDIWEFYDLQEDPDELKNSIDNPAYAEIIKEMKAELKEMMKTTGNDVPVAVLDSITTTNFGHVN